MAIITLQFDAISAMLHTSNFPQLVKNNGTNFPVMGLAFDAATDESAYWTAIAESYGSGNLTAVFYWYADSASSGDVIWGAQIGAITANTDSQDIETKALASAQTVTDSHLGTTGQRLHSASLTISNLDSIAADDWFVLKAYRDADNASDTMTGDAILVLLELTYSDV